MLSQEGVYYYVSSDLWSEQRLNNPRLKGGFTLQKIQSVFHPKQSGGSGFNHFSTSSPPTPPPILITDLLQAIGSNLFSLTIFCPKVKVKA